MKNLYFANQWTYKDAISGYGYLLQTSNIKSNWIYWSLDIIFFNRKKKIKMDCQKLLGPGIGEGLDFSMNTNKIKNIFQHFLGKAPYKWCFSKRFGAIPGLCLLLHHCAIDNWMLLSLNVYQVRQAPQKILEKQICYLDPVVNALSARSAMKEVANLSGLNFPRWPLHLIVLFWQMNRFSISRQVSRLFLRIMRNRQRTGTNIFFFFTSKRKK